MRKRLLQFLMIIAILLTQLVLPTAGSASGAYQGSDPAAKAQALLELLSPEEKVGQLFLISFIGTDVSQGSQIYDLIVNHHIGGVILTSANNNFSDDEDILSKTQELITNLQKDVWLPTQLRPDVLQTPIPSYPPYIPMFIAMSQEGDGAPYDQILTGLTQLPNLMTIGATWNTELSLQAGNVLGAEMKALGFNMLLGPSLDVLDVVQTGTGEDLGTRTFGGDPYWVGVMGQAYIRGVHQGSDDGVAVIAKHFPGRGGSDRPPEEEVATVRKSLEQLKQIELAPFFAVTGNDVVQQAVTDGLLVSHIRYQGFQGNIRAITRPVSFDSAALEFIMALPEFSSWRENGGVVVSDNLGSQAVRKFFDPTGISFDARQVARNAFLAGNDLLYVDDFIASGDIDQYTTIIRTLDYFTQKYEEDAAFADRVDQSVLRLLTLKYKIYSIFDLSTVLPHASGLAIVGTAQDVSFNIARQSVTLISPSAEDLETAIARAPDINERIVFISDSISSQQCADCSLIVDPSVDEMQIAALRLYGPRAGGQVQASNLSSYSFSDLKAFLDGIQPSSQFSYDIQRADWVVILQLSLDSARPESSAFKQLLSERYELISNKKVIVFSLNAPYYLDATEISKVTAYYGIFSKTPMFVDVAVRVLFQELFATGSLPVSVAGIGYDLITAMSPDPNQIIQLTLDLPEEEVIQGTQTPAPTQVPQFFIGDSIPIRTSVIVDHNQHPVPDGTVVRFLFTLGGDVGAAQQIETTTTAGIARTSYHIQSPGVIDIRVVSDPAQTSSVLQINITEGQAGIITAIAPTVGVTSTPANLHSPAVTPSNNEDPAQDGNTGMAIFAWIVFLVIGVSASYGIFMIGKRGMGDRWGLRWAMLTLIGGSIGNILVNSLIQSSNKLYILWSILFSILGFGAGWVAGIVWCRIPEKRGSLAKKGEQETHHKQGDQNVKK